MIKELYVRDFGAVGDGVTDDANAITDAVIALQEVGKDAVLIFDSDKTYYFGEARLGLNSVFTVTSGTRITIRGCNTTLLTDSPNAYMRISGTTDFTIEGIRFNYRIKPYFAVEKAEEINIEDLFAVFKLTKPLEFELAVGEKTKVPINDGNECPFAVIDLPVGRWHMFLDSYELLDSNTLKVWFDKRFFKREEQLRRMNMLPKERLLLPVPYVGHWVNTMCHILDNVNFTMRNIDINSGSKFMFSVSNNDGFVIFDTVNMMPDNDIDFVCWRDGWHLKENHAKGIWKNCKASGLMDDIYNISSSTMYIKQIINNRSFNLFWPETGGAFRRKLEKGEPIQIVNTKTGVILGESEITAVIKQSGSDNIIVIKDVIENLGEGAEYRILFPALVAPGSVIEDCWFDGTYRFRGPITIKNTYFNNRRLWLDVLAGSWLEAPIPWDITFENCQLKFEKEPADEKFVHLTAFNENTAPDAYHVKNVRFINCAVDPEKFEIGTGDEVIFENCAPMED